MAARRGTLNRWQIQERKITGLVRAVHSLRPSFGYRRVAHRIRKDTGERVSVKQVLKCMRKLGIQSRARHKRKFGVGEPHMQFPHLLNRKFRTVRPFEKIATDITYLYSRGKVQYLSVFLDLYNNEILEYEMGDRNDLQFVIQPLKRLLKKEKKKCQKPQLSTRIRATSTHPKHTTNYLRYKTKHVKERDTAGQRLH